MSRGRFLKLLRVLIITDLLRTFADYESYCTFIAFFLDDVCGHDGEDDGLLEMCCETIIQ